MERGRVLTVEIGDVVCPTASVALAPVPDAFLRFWRILETTPFSEEEFIQAEDHIPESGK